MKGQYLAVEYIFVIGLSLILVIASVGLFNAYREEVVETSIDGQTDIVASKMSVQLYNLKQHEQGTVEKTIQLPESMGDRDYEIILANPSNLIIDIQGEEYSYEFPSLSDYDFSGDAEGGDITLYKNNNQISIAG
ncbi:MAG: hypothetical protein ACI977_000437 [Candidatus Nanohaloarchaea archaeon]